MAVETYWVKKPSGTCVQIRLSEATKIKAETELGWIISKTNICDTTPTPTPVAVQLSAQVLQIINDISNRKMLAPEWFVNNNINWVISGHITEQEFLDGYHHYVEAGTIHPVVEDIIITDNMVTQQVINFNIINGRAVGSIKFQATNNFNPHYYNKNIVNIIQIKDPNGVVLLTKENRLNFTKTERDEVINYNESVSENTRITVESYVWSSATAPTPFSKMYSINISETEPPKPVMTGFMGAGVAGAIAGLILIGFIADHKRGK